MPFEIRRDRWAEELDAFTATHEGSLVSIDVLGARIAPSDIDQLSLLGVAVDRLNHDGTIAISVARSTADHVTHIIRPVTRFYLKRGYDGAKAGLLVVSADGTKALLQARATGTPVERRGSIGCCRGEG